MPPTCRVLKSFPWRAAYYQAGSEVVLNATLRSLFLRRGLIEVLGEETVKAKEAKAAIAIPQRRGRPRKVTVA